MTPAARDAAAMAVLDRWLGGQPLEAALTGWARASRYAGSKDRAAVRDTVFDAVRRKRSCFALGGAQTGRGLLIGLARLHDDGLSRWNGQGYAPSPLTQNEQALMNRAVPDLSRGERLDCPDWLLPFLDRALGEEQADLTLSAFHYRAPVFLRINLGKTPSEQLDPFRASLIDELAAQGIVARRHPLAETALLVSGETRRIKLLDSYLDGRIELQDVASQAVALDFFDASINRVGAYVTGVRATQQGLLLGLLEPRAKLLAAEERGDNFSRMAILETAKALPFGAVWDYFCESQGVPPGGKWIDDVLAYEKAVTSKRG